MVTLVFLTDKIRRILDFVVVHSDKVERRVSWNFDPKSLIMFHGAHTPVCLRESLLAFPFSRPQTHAAFCMRRGCLTSFCLPIPTRLAARQYVSGMCCMLLEFPWAWTVWVHWTVSHFFTASVLCAITSWMLLLLDNLIAWCNLQCLAPKLEYLSKCFNWMCECRWIFPGRERMPDPVPVAVVCAGVGWSKKRFFFFVWLAGQD